MNIRKYLVEASNFGAEGCIGIAQASIFGNGMGSK